MHELTECELYNAIACAKSIDEDAGLNIIERFQLEQPALAQTVFGIFPTVIAEQDKDKSQLFMDLCFDTICVFEKSFSPLPTPPERGINWLEKQAVLLDTELQAMMAGSNMNSILKTKLQNRFVERKKAFAW